MKTTIKDRNGQIVVEPSIFLEGHVYIEIQPYPLYSYGMNITLTQDQVGALVVGLEQAAAKAVAA